MIKIKNFLLVLSILFSFSSFSQIDSNESPENLTYFKGELLLQHIKILSSDEFEGRRTGTKGSEKAREYIIKQFETLKVLPLGDGFLQEFSFKRKDNDFKGVNIIGQIKGTEFPDTYIVISAHYDHLGVRNGEVFNGADDDASGTSALFSFAEYFKKYPPRHSVILAAFDSEEMGLRGSKYFVENSIVPLKSIMINLNMDMISRNDKNELFAVGTRYNKTLRQLILDFDQSKKISLLIGHDGEDGKQDWTGSSDHGSFHKKGIPFLYFGVEDHDDYHKESDEFENIHPEFYKEAVRVIISVFKEVDAIQL